MGETADAVPPRPHFEFCGTWSGDGTDAVVDTEGREWSRVVFDRDGTVCAAQSAAGVLLVWDQGGLFDAVFRAVDGG